MDLAEALCTRNDVDPRQVIHLPCDGFAARDLRRAFTLGRELTRFVDRHARCPRVWLLDEVTGIAGWSATVKAARDGSDVGSDTVVLSGSRWLATEDVEGNLLAGRAGSGGGRRVRHVHPMSFRDFVRATRPALAPLGHAHPSDLQSPPVEAMLQGVAFDVDDYDFAWQDYLRVGGFPRAVAEFYRKGAVSAAYVEDLQAWLRTDVDPEREADAIPLLLNELERRMSSPLNVRATAEAMHYSRNSFPPRLQRLVSGFAAIWCPQRNEHGAAVTGAQAKLYLTDPLLAWIPSRLRAGLPEPDMTRLTEAAIGIALARAIDQLQARRWVNGDTIGYLRTASDGEIDLAPVPVSSAAGPQTTVPLESKWVDANWRSEARVIENKYQSGILATKSILDLDHPVWALPAPMLALLLQPEPG
jgi:predicted AAA+ superfamily ATPase